MSMDMCLTSPHPNGTFFEHWMIYIRNFRMQLLEDSSWKPDAFVANNTEQIHNHETTFHQSGRYLQWFVLYYINHFLNLLLVHKRFVCIPHSFSINQTNVTYHHSKLAPNIQVSVGVQDLLTPTDAASAPVRHFMRRFSRCHSKLLRLITQGNSILNIQVMWLKQ